MFAIFFSNFYLNLLSVIIKYEKLFHKIFNKDLVYMDHLMECPAESSDNTDTLFSVDTLKRYLKEHDENRLILHLKSKEAGSRMVTRIEIKQSGGPFVYEPIVDTSRGDEKKQVIRNLLKVRTSEKIAQQVEVFLDEKEDSVVVRMFMDEFGMSPKVALLNLTEQTDNRKMVMVENPVFDKKEGCFKYLFKNLNPGSYFLFIEPLFMV